MIEVMTIADVIAHINHLEYNIGQVQKSGKLELLEPIIKQIEALKTGLDEQSKIQTNFYMEMSKSRKNTDNTLRDINHEFDKEIEALNVSSNA